MCVTSDHLHLADRGEVLGDEPGAEPLVHGGLPVQPALGLSHGGELGVPGDGEAVRHVGHHELPALHHQAQPRPRHALDQLNNLTARKIYMSRVEVDRA